MVNFGDFSNFNIRANNAAASQSLNVSNLTNIFKSNLKNIFPESNNTSDNLDELEDEFAAAAALAGKVDSCEEQENSAPKWEDFPNDFVELAFDMYADLNAKGEKNIPELSRLRSSFYNGGYKDVINSDKVKIAYMQNLTDDYINKKGGAKDIPEYYALSQEFKQTPEYTKAAEFLESVGKYTDEQAQSNNVFMKMLKHYLLSDSKLT